MNPQAICLAEPDVAEYRVFVFEDESDAVRLQDCDGRSLAANWTPIRVRTFDEKGGSRKPIADISGMLPIPLFCQSAYDSVRHALDTSGEFLPIHWEDKMLWGLNVTKIVDCLDEPRSNITRFRDGAIMDIKKYAFKNTQDLGMSFFKLPQLRRGQCLATKAAAQLLADLGLTGLRMRAL